MVAVYVFQYNCTAASTDDGDDDGDEGGVGMRITAITSEQE